MVPARGESLPPRSVIVVGAGLAGFQSVAALRAHGFDGRVVVLGAEGVSPYDRPPLSKHLLDRPEPAWLADELGTDALGLADEVHLSRPARSLTADEHGVGVRTDDQTVRADAVVIATGAHSLRVPGARTPGIDSVLTLHTVADAARLRARLRPGVHLVIIGAGWIGAEVAGVAAAGGAHVTVVEALDAPLATALGPHIGSLTTPWYAAAGVELVTAVRVEQVRGDGVLLSDGRLLRADVVLAAVGARPSTGWLVGSLPLEPDGSVLVDGSYAPVGGPRTVRAVGDVALRQSPRHGLVPGGHWDGALRGPEIAVRSLLAPRPDPDVQAAAGLSAVSGAADDPAPYVFSTQLGHELAIYGHAHPADDVVRRGPAAGVADGWSVLWFRPGSSVLTAVLAVDRPRDVAAARRLFSGPTLPLLDRTRAADPTVALRSATVEPTP